MSTQAKRGRSMAERRDLAEIADRPNARAVAAFDADPPGERYAGYLTKMAAEAGVASERLIPPDGWKDWNQVLTRRADG